MNLAAKIVERLSRDPDRRLFSMLSSDAGRVVSTWSAGRLLREAAAWSARFAAAGVASGDRVALSPDRDGQAAALHLAALASGLPIVPVSNALSDAETAALLEASLPSLVVTSRVFADARPQTRARAGMPWWTLEAAAMQATPDREPRAAGASRAMPDREAPEVVASRATPDHHAPEAVASQDRQAPEAVASRATPDHHAPEAVASQDRQDRKSVV